MENITAPETAPKAENLPAAPAETIEQKIERLQAETIAAYKAQHVFDNPFDDAAKAAANVYNGLNGQLEAAKMELVKQANEAALMEQKNQRIALIDTAIEAAIDYEQLQAAIGENASEADKAELIAAETAAKTAREIVVNELLAKFAGSIPAKKAGSNGTAKKAGSNNKAAIKAEILKLWLDSGKLLSTSNFENDLHFKRATAWHAVNDWKIANNVSTADVDKLIETAGPLAVATAVETAKKAVNS